MKLTLSPRELSFWKLGVFGIFASCGIALSTWASRIPTVKDNLDVTKADLGFALVAFGVASLIGLSVASIILIRLGTKRGITIHILMMSLALLVIGLAVDVSNSYLLLTLGLALFGLSLGVTEVLMNVEGAAVERYLGKTVMPICHGFFSFGAFVGAAIGAVAEQTHLSFLVHILLAAAVITGIICFSVSTFQPHENANGTPAAESSSRRNRLRTALFAWRELRTYTIGLVLFGMALAEGSAVDWLALAVVEGHKLDGSTGAIALALFTGSMMVIRMVGGPIVDRFGRVASLRALAICAAVGIVLFVATSYIPLVVLGVVLWGIGASLGFPLAISAAADDPTHAAARVSAVASIGYLAFLAGPPVLGVISTSIGLLPTFLIVAAFAVISTLAAGATRPSATQSSEQSSELPPKQ